jgi:hypothetical protein
MHYKLEMNMVDLMVLDELQLYACQFISGFFENQSWSIVSEPTVISMLFVVPFPSLL